VVVKVTSRDFVKGNQTRYPAFTAEKNQGFPAHDKAAKSHRLHFPSISVFFHSMASPPHGPHRSWTIDQRDGVPTPNSVSPRISSEPSVGSLPKQVLSMSVPMVAATKPLSLHPSIGPEWARRQSGSFRDNNDATDVLVSGFSMGAISDASSAKRPKPSSVYSPSMGPPQMLHSPTSSKNKSAKKFRAPAPAKKTAPLEPRKQHVATPQKPASGNTGILLQIP
jgi:hypothetical protein